MLDYRRNRVPGGTFFFTVNLLDRRSNLLVTQIDALRDAVRRVRARACFRIDAWVVLPDHLHSLWTLPEGDEDFRHFPLSPLKGERDRHPPRRERGIWQRGYWEHTIRDDGTAPLISTTFTSTRSSTAWSNIRPIDRIRRSLANRLYPAGWTGGRDEPPEAGERQ